MTAAASFGVAHKEGQSQSGRDGQGTPAMQFSHLHISVEKYI